MNKYSLKFISQNLEVQYQIARYDYTLPTFEMLNAITLSICLLKILIPLLYLELFSVVLFSSASAVLLVAQLTLVKYKKHWIDNYMLLLNHIAMLYQAYLEVGFESQEAFIFGSDQMVMHAVTILVSDFVPAIIQIIGNIAIKLSIAYYFQPSFSYISVIYTLIVSIPFVIVIYRINQQYRQSFLFTSNDRLQEKMIPVLIDNPFVICYYDEHSVSFQVRHSNLQQHKISDKFKTSNQCLGSLLRKYKVYGQTLESFLLSRRQFHEHMFVNKTLEAFDQRNSLVIKYSEYVFTDFYFLLIIDQKEKKLITAKTQYDQVKKRVINLSQQMHKFLMRQLKTVTKSESSSVKLLKVKLNLMHFLTKFEDQKESIIQPYRLLHKICTFSSLFQKAHKRKILVFSKIKFEEIWTKKLIFDTLLILLMNYLIKVEHEITIYITQHLIDECFNIEIQADSHLYTKLQTSSHFRKCLQQIGPYNQVKIEGERILITIYRDLNYFNRDLRFDQQ